MLVVIVVKDQVCKAQVHCNTKWAMPVLVLPSDTSGSFFDHKASE